MRSVLKVGGAYVPLDAAYPRERLEWMAADARLAGLILDRQGADTFAGWSHGPMVRLDTDEVTMAADCGDNLATRGTATDLAYVIYTSGSTGQPKGAAVPHRGVLRLVLNADYISISEHDTFLAASPASFDASTLEVWDRC